MGMSSLQDPVWSRTVFFTTLVLYYFPSCFVLFLHFSRQMDLLLCPPKAVSAPTSAPLHTQFSLEWSLRTPQASLLTWPLSSHSPPCLRSKCRSHILRDPFVYLSCSIGSFVMCCLHRVLEHGLGSAVPTCNYLMLPSRPSEQHEYAAHCLGQCRCSVYIHVLLHMRIHSVGIDLRADSQVEDHFCLWREASKNSVKDFGMEDKNPRP